MVNVNVRKETGKLFFDFYYLKKRCREYTLLPDNVANRRRLEAAAKKIDAEITLGTFQYRKYFPNSKKADQFDLLDAKENSPPCGVPLFGEFVPIWLKENMVRWRSNTQAANTGTINKHLHPVFHDVPINDISKADCLALRAEIAKAPGLCGNATLTPKTVNHIMGLLHMILAEAGERYGFKNPMDGIQRLKQRRPDIQPFSLKEVQAIIGAVRPDYRSYFIVRFFTGMRTGELHGLKWKYVDFENRQILVRETFAKGKTDLTKTMGSDREITMCQMVYDALKAQSEITAHLTEYVFCTSTYTPLDTKNVANRIWYPLLDQLGLERRRPYHCRHTAATLWLASGENPEWIARQLGHNNTEMLFRVYSRYVPNLTRRDGSAFDRLVTGTFTTEVSHDER